MDAFDAAGSLLALALRRVLLTRSGWVGVSNMLFSANRKAPDVSVPPAEQALWGWRGYAVAARKWGGPFASERLCWRCGSSCDEGLAVDPGFQRMAAPFIPAEGQTQ